MQRPMRWPGVTCLDYVCAPLLAAGGDTAAACEEALAADAYRVRTLLAHWLAEGAAAVSQFAPPAPPAAPETRESR